MISYRVVLNVSVQHDIVTVGHETYVYNNFGKRGRILVNYLFLRSEMCKQKNTTVAKIAVCTGCQ